MSILLDRNIFSLINFGYFFSRLLSIFGILDKIQRKLSIKISDNRENHLHHHRRHLRRKNPATFCKSFFDLFFVLEADVLLALEKHSMRPNSMNSIKLFSNIISNQLHPMSSSYFSLLRHLMMHVLYISFDKLV